MLNVSTFLDNSADKYANKPAFTFLDTTLTFAQIHGAANQIANGLIAQGIKKGDKIALSCLNLPYFPMVYFGILKMGGDPIPTPFISMVNQVSKTKFHSKFEANPKRITRLEKQPIVEDRVVIPRAELGKDAYRCKPNEGLLLTSEGAMIVTKPYF